MRRFDDFLVTTTIDQNVSTYIHAVPRGRRPTRFFPQHRYDPGPGVSTLPASSPFPKRFPLVNPTDGALLLALRIWRVRRREEKLIGQSIGVAVDSRSMNATRVKARDWKKTMKRVRERSIDGPARRVRPVPGARPRAPAPSSLPRSRSPARDSSSPSRPGRGSTSRTTRTARAAGRCASADRRSAPLETRRVRARSRRRARPRASSRRRLSRACLA